MLEIISILILLILVGAYQRLSRIQKQLEIQNQLQRQFMEAYSIPPQH